MAWGAYMLRKSFVLVIIRFRVLGLKCCTEPQENPTTVNRVQQPAAIYSPIRERYKIRFDIGGKIF